MIIVLLDMRTTGVELTSVPLGDVMTMFPMEDINLLCCTRLQKQVFWQVENSSLSKLRVVNVCAGFSVGVGLNEVYRDDASDPDFDLSMPSTTDQVESRLGALLKEDNILKLCDVEGAFIVSAVNSTGGTSCFGDCVGESASILCVVKPVTEKLAFRDEQQADANTGDAATDEEMVSVFMTGIFFTVINRSVLDGTRVIDGNKTVSF